MTSNFFSIPVGAVLAVILAHAGIAEASFLPSAVNGNIGIGTTAPSAKLDVTGSVTISGDVTMGANLTVGGKGSVNTLILVPAAVTLVSNTGVPAILGTFMRIAGAGGAAAVVDPGATQLPVAGMSDGQELVLYGTSNTATVKFHDGDTLSLSGGVSATFKNHDTMRLIFNATDNLWHELSRMLR